MPPLPCKDARSNSAPTVPSLYGWPSTDGIQTILVTAVAKDGEETITITTRVTRETGQPVKTGRGTGCEDPA